MNPFEKYGLTHLSASSLNCYADQPAFWALKYLHGFKDEAGPDAWRGHAVEAGLDLWLFKRDLDAAKEAALIRFEQDALGDLSENVERQRDVIIPMLEIACNRMQDIPPPEARQVKIEHWFDGIEIPLIGYVDYLWPEVGRDLKTTMRMPSTIPSRHARQVSLYQVVKQRPFEILYVTERRGEIKKIEDAETHVKRLEWYAHAIRRVLSVFPDKMDAARIFAPEFDSFYWKSEAARTAAAEIWN